MRLRPVSFLVTVLGVVMVVACLPKVVREDAVE